MMYLDTHIVVWLYQGSLEKFNRQTTRLLEKHELLFSPIVYLELQYLHEIKRITCPAKEIIDNLTEKLGLMTADIPLFKLVKLASQIDWTRDPFDRLIVAEAKFEEALLLTKDTTIRKHYPHAIWHEG